MDILNAHDARVWLHAWNGNPPNGTMDATIDGLAMAYAISASGGHWQLAQGYAEAIAALETNA